MHRGGGRAAQWPALRFVEPAISSRHLGEPLKRRVSVLCHTVSGNALGRAWVIAELLRPEFDVELVCSARNSDLVWKPLRDEVQGERRWFIRTWPAFHLNARRVARELVTGDAIVAIKPRLHSYGLALAARRERPRPVILDIDDWELGFFSPWLDALGAPFNWISAASNLHTRWYFLQTHRADAITVSSSALQQRFGGEWLPHARAIPPAPVGEGQSATPLVVFIGTPRPHKGLSDLIAAFRQVDLREARLRIVGVSEPRQIAHLAGDDPRISIEPPTSFGALAQTLREAWLVVIPQRTGSASVAQLPAKLMDAMAFGKAILSTRVGDIPKWLADGCGVVVEPAAPVELAAAMRTLLVDRGRLDDLGRKARARFLDWGSMDVLKPRLLALVDSMLSGKPSA